MRRLVEFIKRIILNTVSLLRKRRFWIASLFLIFVSAIFLLNASHESYPDEFDNISGGWLILHGDLIYKSFFTHHGPFPYFLSSFLEIFSGQSFVKFRIVYAIFLVIINFSFFAFLRLKFKEKIINFYPLFIVLLGIESAYYWSQMLLADNIAAYCFLFLFVLLLLKFFYKKTLTTIDLIFVSIIGALGLYSSLTFTYLYAIFVFAYFALFISQNGSLINKKSFVRVGKVMLIFAFPHLVYFTYLLLTQSLHDYFFQNFVFNAKYYIYNYPRPSDSTTINPLRYAIVIANNYFNNLFPLFMQIKNFNLFNPFNVAMALGNMSMFIYLILKKHYQFAFICLLIIIFSTVRTNPLTSGETDYQSAVYIFISLFSMLFLLINLYEDINSHKDNAMKVIMSFLLILLLAYSVATVFSFFESFNNRFFEKYMGKAPLIYDRPKIAPIMNAILDKKDYAWIGPFNFEDIFYMNAIPASRYHILIPGLAKSEDTRNQLIFDLEKTKPKAIWFNKHTYILGNSVEKYASFLTDYLDKNYITISQYKMGKVKYASVAQKTIGIEGVEIESSLFLRPDYAPEAIQKLVNAGYLKPQ